MLLSGHGVRTFSRRDKLRAGKCRRAYDHKPGTGNRDSIRIEADRAPVRKGKGRRNRAWSSLLLKSTGNIEVTMLY